jgi:Tfp pilus assembly protein PilF
MKLPSMGLRVAFGVLVVCGMLAATQVWAQPASMGALGTPLPAADEKIPEVADAKARFMKLDFSGALDLLREAVKKNPDRLPPPQVIMFMWFGQANQGAAALASLERAVVEEPDDPQAYMILANIELQGGRVTAAGLLFEKAEALMGPFTKSPTRKKNLEPGIYAGLAAVAESRAIGDEDEARAKQQWVSAEGNLREWLKLDPNNAMALQRLARALFKEGTLEKQDREKAKQKVNEAYERLKEAKKADPKVHNPAATMALFYQEEGDFKNAQKFMDYALSPQVGADDLQTRLDAARWCLQTSLLEPGQLKKAEDHATKALQLDPTNPDGRVLRGVIALFQKEYETAERFFKVAFLDQPSNFPASNDLALALCEQDETKKRQALQYAERNAQLYNNSPEAAVAASTYGWVLYKNNRIADADNVLNRLLRSGARLSEDTLYYAARVATDPSLRDRRRPEEARQLLERAVASKRPFSMRPEAQRLLESLRRETGSR